MKNKLTLKIVILIVIAMGIGILFLPVPQVFRENVICVPCPPNDASCRCPKKGDIIWTPSLVKRYILRLPRPPQYLVNVNPINPSPPPNWQRYTHPTLGYTFDYPGDFEIKEIGNRVVVSNGLQIVITTLEPREVTVANFELTIEPIHASWDEIVDQLSYEGDLTFGSHTFREVYTGAEGDGIRAYFLDLGDGRWLEFAKREYFEGAIVEEYHQDPRYLDTTEQKELVRQILSTVTLTDPNKP